MKRYLIMLLALLLSIPAFSYAGSMTSKYDVTFGGYVKMDVVYTDENNTHNYRAATRDNRRTFAENLNDSYDAVTWAGGETRINFRIKGPDAWGAKTSAFIEGDFRGGSGGGQGVATYGLFGLRHAFMSMDWAQQKLLIGHTWQAWGLLPTFNVLGASENHFMRGNVRVPQIRMTQSFTKNLDMTFALAAPTNTFGNTQPDDKSRALYPDTSVQFVYKTPAMGKIGPWSLTFGLGGMVGKEKVTFVNNTVYPNHYRSAPVTRWGSSFYGYIPIIPEKANNKQNALALTGNVFMGQGLGLYLPAAPNNPYDRPTDAATGAGPYLSADSIVTPRYPMTSGGWAQITYYYTEKMSSNLLFGWQRNDISSRYYRNQAGVVRYIQNWIFNVMYDVSPAVRFGAEYTRIMTSYSQWTATGKPSGTLNAVRLGAYYYF